MNQLRHVAIIMDGNGRWGIKKKRSRNYGHLKELDAVEKIIRASIKKKIPHLTLYTFSTENWNRPHNEINFLFNLIRNSMKKNIKRITNQGIKINIIGKKKGLPKDISQTINSIQKITNKNKRITVNLALNYGSKEEIISACKLLKNEKHINIKKFENKLYTKNIPNPDLLIRTGGTKRLSNFLLWQMAYTEIFFVDDLWPDFNEKLFNKIVKNFYNIKRNYGNV